MPREYHHEVRSRARKIRKANKPTLTTKDYIQRILVILIILGILITALYLSDSI